MNHVLSDVFGIDDPAHRRDRRRDLRPHRRMPRRRRVPAASAARPVRHRGRRHDRRRPERPRPPPAARRRRLRRPGDPDVPTGLGGRSRPRGVRRARRSASASSPVATPPGGTTTSPRCSTAASSPSRSAPPPPTTATRRRSRPRSTPATAQRLLDRRAGWNARRRRQGDAARAGARRDGRDEHRGRVGDAAPPRFAPQPQPTAVRTVRTRHRRRHPRPDRLRRRPARRCSTGSATTRGSGWSPSRSTRSTFSRELAPLAGHYPALYLGPPWWFLDSVEGMLRFRRLVTETAGFANTTGFVDDTRAFLSIPARHDVARRVDCRYLAELVSDHRLELDEAHEIAHELAVGLPRRVFNLRAARGVMPRLADSTVTTADCGPPRTTTAATMRCGIVHLGLGAFSRAHLAVYADDLLARGSRRRRRSSASRCATTTCRTRSARRTACTRSASSTVRRRTHRDHRIRAPGTARPVAGAPRCGRRWRRPTRRSSRSPSPRRDTASTRPPAVSTGPIPTSATTSTIPTRPAASSATSCSRPATGGPAARAISPC